VSVPVIHAVTSDDIVAREDVIALAVGVMRVLGPRGAVHLRAPATSPRRLFDLATALAPHQESTGAWLAVNDRVDVAHSVGARAVQLTSRSLTVADARAAIRAASSDAPPIALGASVHTVEEARAASEGADDTREPRLAWLVAGHVFATPSHAGVPERGSSFLGEICAAVPIPVIAIGGVRPANVGELLAAGAYGVAVIRGIWHAVDAERAAADYLSAYDAVRDARAAGSGGSGAHS
jgi:thiazole tautomerase (transcriptional regulator TenI)